MWELWVCIYFFLLYAYLCVVKRWTNSIMFTFLPRKQTLSTGLRLCKDMLIGMFCFHMPAGLAPLRSVPISESGEKWFCTGMSTAVASSNHYLPLTSFFFTQQLNEAGDFLIRFVYKNRFHPLKKEEDSCTVMNDLSQLNNSTSDTGKRKKNRTWLWCWCGGHLALQKVTD